MWSRVYPGSTDGLPATAGFAAGLVMPNPKKKKTAPPPAAQGTVTAIPLSVCTVHNVPWQHTIT